MSRIINTTSTVTLNPSGYTNQSSTLSFISGYPASNGFTNVSNTSEARFATTTRSQWAYFDYTFDTSGIPTAATISSVTASARVRVSSTNQSTSMRLQMYSGTTAMGTQRGFASTTSTTTSISAGTWNRSQIEDMRLHVGIYTTSSTPTSRYGRFYGANVSITYNLSTVAYTIAATSHVNGVTVSPASQEIYAGEDATEIRFDCDDINDYTVTDNGEDITNLLVKHSLGTSSTASAIPGSSVTTGFNRSNSNFYQSSNTTSDGWLRYAIGHSAENPYSTSNTSNTYVKDRTNDANTKGWMNYPFDFSSIPANAIIDSVSVQVYGASESLTETARHADVELYSGTTLKSTTQSFSSTSNGIMTITNPGTWTRTELQNAQLRFIVGYYGGRILGATWEVTYHTPTSGYYWTYSLLNVSDDHVILVDEQSVFIPPEEDPNETYWPITISSINATTSPPNGTTRVLEGTNHTINIIPSDPQLTLALDNGVDITNQLQSYTNNTYTVTTQVSGASYGFTLNNNTGYYVSGNTGVSNSAAVARVNFDLDTDCVVTIQYINYAEATYDYGIFGRPDTALGTTYTTDSNPYLSCSGSSYNTSSAQTLTYDLTAGTHFIDIKYRKDEATNSNNDNLQWKILSIEASGGGGNYTYTLTNVRQKHSLVFVFGNVNFYYITSSSASGAKLFPDGQIVVLEGDSYHLNIVPDNINAAVTITDNNVNKTAELEELTGVDKNNNPVISYTYKLTNIQAAHTIVVTVGASSTQIYLKQNGSWVAYSKVYKKINGSWIEQSDLSSVFSTSANYVKGN